MPDHIWFKSSYSDDHNPNCVEVATTPRLIHVRDSKDPYGPTLAFPAAEWAHFVTFAKEVTSTAATVSPR
ncbi:DUF397 domain-containing protein [Streptomyces sp. URMC 123]|uniref:DUF397 domain-containing protein n=1 Tax=Streptomyces sp. URMC 123 TaxID=3423403 RepID=UPI003F1BA782